MPRLKAETGQAPSLTNLLSNIDRFRVSPEETIWLPLGAMVAIGDVDEQGSDDLFVFRGGGEVDRLVHVVGWRVIALGQPVFEDSSPRASRARERRS